MDQVAALPHVAVACPGYFAGVRTICRYWIDPSVPCSMIGPGTGVRVYLACGATDMRKGIGGLAALAQNVLRQKPASGAVFAYRGRRGDRLKLLYWDGQGFCLYYKVLERGRFPWPTARSSPPASRLARHRLLFLATSTIPTARLQTKKLNRGTTSC